MLTREDVIKRRDEIMKIAERYGASDVRIFGSVARGEADEDSDLDLVVRMAPGRTLLDQGGLLMDLRELFGMKVDVMSDGALEGRFADNVTRDAVPL